MSPNRSKSARLSRYAIAPRTNRRYEQLLVGTDLDDPPGEHDHHPVSIARGLEPVGDGDDRPPGRNAASARSVRPAERGRAARSPRRAPGCGGRRGPPAPVRAAGAGPPSPQPPADLGVHSVGQSGYPVRRHRLERLVELGVGRGRGAQQQVVADRAPEQVLVLGNQLDLLAQLLWAEIGDRHAAEGTVPAWGRSDPASNLASVVLPAPDGPTSVNRSPGWTVRVTSERTSPSSAS